MPKQNYRVGDREIPGEEVEFEVEREGFNTYILADGSKLKMKTVVNKIVRLDAWKPDGEPVYLINSANVATSDVPERLKKSPRST